MPGNTTGSGIAPRFDRGLEKYLAKYKGADHDAVPAITPRAAVHPQRLSLPKGEIAVTLTIEPDGTVSGGGRRQ